MGEKIDNNNPLVSVVMATCNRERYIAKALESILKQSFKNLEIIIVDDSTSDATKNLIKNLSKQIISAIKIIYIKNEKKEGFVRSLNKGIDLARGKYIARLDDDDWWLDNKKIDKQVSFLEENPDYILVGGGSVGMNERGEEIYKVLPPQKDEEIREVMLFDCIFQHSTVLFRKDIWRLVGGYNENLSVCEDWDLWLRMGKFGKFYNFKEYLAGYLIQDKNKKIGIRRKNALTHLKLKIKYRKLYPHFIKAFILGIFILCASMVYHFDFLSKLFIIPKIKNLFFKKSIYLK